MMMVYHDLAWHAGSKRVQPGTAETATIEAFHQLSHIADAITNCTSRCIAPFLSWACRCLLYRQSLFVHAPRLTQFSGEIGLVQPLDGTIRDHLR